MVTPQLFLDQNIRSVPASMVMAQADNPDSLEATMNTMLTNLLNFDDLQKMQALANPDGSGWNTYLWDELKNKQALAASLMDYQMWNVSSHIEEQAVEHIQQNLEERLSQLQLQQFTQFTFDQFPSDQFPPDMDDFVLPDPQAILTAFQNSNKSGWFAATPPSPADAFARMDIVAELVGSLTGTVYEQRNFTIPGAGQSPVYGIQTGYDTVLFDHPELGEMTFEVDITLDQFDAAGLAVGGEVIAENKEHGYRVHFVFKEDGTKEGKVFLNEKQVGKLTMSLGAETFENYLDIETGMETPLPAFTP